jgi:NAD(P)H-dependent flavin oxidoreductase YrpB (nitropropane dioxygenase family)
MYESWGAEFLVVEGREAGGHLGDPDASLDRLLREVREATSLPLVAAGGLADGADIGRVLALGAQGVQLATRFILTTDCEVHPNFKLMHMGRTGSDVVTIRSTVKGMQARAIRNSFTDRLNTGDVFPPKDKRRYYGPGGLHGRRGACDECLADGVCTSRLSRHRQSFCINDALLRAAIDGDTENGLFYTGAGVERLPERSLSELGTAEQVVAMLERQLADWEHGGDLR